MSQAISTPCPDLADPGDWQGRLYNAQLPWLRSLGYEVVPGTLDADGCDMLDPDGRRKRLLLLSPGVSEIRDDDRDEMPSDNHPDIPGRYMLVFGRGRPIDRDR